MPGNIQNIRTSHFLITWIVFLSIKCTKSQTQAGDSCDLVNFVFCLALPGCRQVNTSGRETICSDGDGVGEKGVCVLLVRNRKTELQSCYGAWATGVWILQSGDTTPTHTRLNLQSQAVCQAPCGDTHQLGSTLTHTHILWHKPNIDPLFATAL